MAAPKPTRQTFAQDVLNGIGAPITGQNMALLLAWMAGENTAAANNPLATTQPWQNATDFNVNGGHPVKNYATYQDGVSATITTLNNGYYPGIVGDLRKGNVAPNDVVNQNASEFNTWGTGAGLISSILNSNGGLIPTQGGGTFPNANAPITSLPEQAAAAVIGGLTKPVTTALSDTGKYILYGVAFLGGGLLLITGLILIGADIGLGIFARTPQAKLGQKVIGAIPARREQKANVQRTQRTQARAEQISESRVKQQTHREAVARARVRQERARARERESAARVAKSQEAKPKPRSVKVG